MSSHPMPSVYLYSTFVHSTNFFSLFFFFSSRRRHTRYGTVTGVQTCALPICEDDSAAPTQHCPGDKTRDAISRVLREQRPTDQRDRKSVV